MRRRFEMVAVLMTAAVAAACLAGSASASSSTLLCPKIATGKYQCSFYPPGNGLTAGAPVLATTGARVGYLNGGGNWIVCQASGATVDSAGSYNRWWGYTEADDQHFGWVNAVWASGGTNDGEFYSSAGQPVPNCGSTYGTPPQPTSIAPTPAPPTPVSCSYQSAGRYSCYFYPAGDGISGGTPVASGQTNVGFLNQGYNWVVCQQLGGSVNLGADTNDWWAYTEADDHKWGWANALYGRGGSNDGPFGGVPACNGEYGSPPGAASAAPKPKPTPAPKNMVVLGDSYSSGEGTQPTFGGDCIQSKQAYGWLAASALGYHMQSFAACAGATTQDVLDKQLGSLNAQTTLVTMSVGGDDADFAKVLKACVVGLGVWTSPCTNWAKTATGVIRDQLPGRLDRLYSAIHSRAPHARVVIVGYPTIFGACADGSVFDKLHGANELLDDTVKAAAARHGFVFVDPRGTFTGHSVCDKDPWINGIHVSWNRLWFHPTSAGSQAEAKLVEASL
jgi:hypothetical protein